MTLQCILLLLLLSIAKQLKHYLHNNIMCVAVSVQQCLQMRSHILAYALCPTLMSTEVLNQHQACFTVAIVYSVI